MHDDALDRSCRELLGGLLAAGCAPDPMPAAPGWPEHPQAGWEAIWEEQTRAAVQRAGAALCEQRAVREATLAGWLAHHAAAVRPESLHRIVGERIAIEPQDRFACDPATDFWYFKINHGYWEQLYGIHGSADPVTRRFADPAAYREAYAESGFSLALESLMARQAQDDGHTLSFPGIAFGMSLEAGNHDHATVLRRFPDQPSTLQRIPLGATIGLLGTFDTLFGPRQLRFADGSFPKRAAVGGTLRDTLSSFARAADRIVFVVPLHLRGIRLDVTGVPQECLPVPSRTVHQAWAAALLATCRHVFARLQRDDRVLVITQSAVFAALLALFLRQAKAALLPSTKRIFFFDLGQVIDSATPGSGGVWISRNAVHDATLFQVTDAG
jgi:hypothetical protein